MTIDTPTVSRRVEATSDHNIEFIKSPRSLSEDVKLKIKNDLIAGMDKVNVSGYFESANDIFYNLDYLVVASGIKKPSVDGVFACRWVHIFGEPMLYIQTTKVVTKFQGSRLFATMVSFCFDEILADQGDFPQYVLFKTVNPIVYRYTAYISSGHESVLLYPNIPSLKNSGELASLASEVVKVICPGLHFCPENGVISNAMRVAGRGYYSEMAKSGSPTINQFFEENLTLDDQLLGIIYIPREVFPSFLNRVRSASLNREKEINLKL